MVVEADEKASDAFIVQAVSEEFWDAKRIGCWALDEVNKHGSPSKPNSKERHGQASPPCQFSQSEKMVQLPRQDSPTETKWKKHC